MRRKKNISLVLKLKTSLSFCQPKILKGKKYYRNPNT